MAASQQPLLPVQHGSPAQPGLGVRRPNHASPAKELVLAVQHGDVEGALRAASWACVRSPLLLFTILVFLVGALGLASWLLPQHPLTSVLRQASRRQGGPRQRTFLEELTREEQQQLIAAAKHTPAARHQSHHKAARSREEMLDALIFPRARGGAQEAAAVSELVGEMEPPSKDGGAAANASDGHGQVFNIHEVAKVPPLFGEHP